MKDFYESVIAEAVEACQDLELLDLVWKLLQESATTPRPGKPTESEVNANANNQRNTSQHRAIAVQICSRAKHSDSLHPKMGNRCKQLPRVCGGADSLPRAA